MAGTSTSVQVEVQIVIRSFAALVTFTCLLPWRMSYRRVPDYPRFVALHPASARSDNDSQYSHNDIPVDHCLSSSAAFTSQGHVDMNSNFSNQAIPFTRTTSTQTHTFAAQHQFPNRSPTHLYPRPQTYYDNPPSGQHTSYHVRHLFDPAWVGQGTGVLANSDAETPREVNAQIVVSYVPRKG